MIVVGVVRVFKEFREFRVVQCMGNRLPLNSLNSLNTPVACFIVSKHREMK